MLRALAREKPDRLPVTVHQWQKYHLDTYLGGVERPRGLPTVRAGRVDPVLPGHGPVLARGRRLHQVLDPRVAGRGGDPQRRSRPPGGPAHHHHAGGDPDLRGRGQPDDDLGHRVPDQARRRHPAHREVHARAAARPGAGRPGLRRRRRRRHPARLRLGRPGRLLAARRLPHRRASADLADASTTPTGSTSSCASSWRRSCASSNP